MIEQPGQTLTDLAQRLAMRLLPELNGAFYQADAGLITALLLALAQDFERAVDNRMRDVSEMQNLFAGAQQALRENGAGALAGRLQDFAGEQPDSLRLADVDRLHAAGFNLMIELHAWAEQHNPQLDKDIWLLLQRHCERNKFELPNL